MAPTSDERREVAERLRATKAECDERGYPWMVEDLMQALGFGTYEDGDEGIFDRLADLIDPTCHDASPQASGVFECSEMELTREQITEKRERLGLSKSAFGRESGLHVSTISQIESGRLIPYPGQMKKIVAAFSRLEKGQVR